MQVHVTYRRRCISSDEDIGRQQRRRRPLPRTGSSASASREHCASLVGILLHMERNLRTEDSLSNSIPKCWPLTVSDEHHAAVKAPQQPAAPSPCSMCPQCAVQPGAPKASDGQPYDCAGATACCQGLYSTCVLNDDMNERNFGQVPVGKVGWHAHVSRLQLRARYVAAVVHLSITSPTSSCSQGYQVKLCCLCRLELVHDPAAAALQVCALFNPSDIVPETLADDDEELPTDPSADRLAMVQNAAYRADGIAAQQP
jgi:hypothetical protein